MTSVDYPLAYALPLASILTCNAASGLGLAICRAIVQAHGGQIRVEDGGAEPRERIEDGAEFVVTLPTVRSVTS